MRFRFLRFGRGSDDDGEESRRRGLLARIPPYVLSVYLVACLLFGGASNAGFVANAALQLIGLAIIFWLLLDRNVDPTPRQGKALIWIGGAIVVVILLQLVPLPPQLWSGLPGRQGIARGFAMLGMVPPWLPLSFDRERTVASAMWLIPAATVLMLMLKLRARGVRHVLPALAIATTLSVFVGIGQTVQGDESRLYFYERTNLGSMTGFFSNSNHLATLLLMTMPFLAALFTGAGGRFSRSAPVVRHVLFAATIFLILIGLIGDRSLAGLGLMLPTLIASVLLYFFGKRDLRSRKRLLGMLGGGLAALVVALVVAAAFVPLPAVDDGPAHAVVQKRPVIFANSARAGLAVFPFGSGLGSMQRIYPSFEDPATVTDVFINHSHNDYLEVFLELGLPGLLLFAVFFIWWLRRTISAWWGVGEQALLARAGSIASGAVMAHSFVDYPLRTAATSTLFVFAIGLMVERPVIRQVRDASGRTERKARHIVVQ